jgi:hypothetical protein
MHECMYVCMYIRVPKSTIEHSLDLPYSSLLALAVDDNRCCYYRHDYVATTTNTTLPLLCTHMLREIHV